MEKSDRKPIDEVTFLDQEAQDFVAFVGNSLSTRDSIDAALSQVIAQVTEFIGAEAISIFLVDESTDDLVVRYATGEVGDQIIGLRLASGQGVVGWVVKYSEDLIVPYPGLDARFFEGVDEHTGFSTRSIACSPICVGARTVGAIEVLNKIDGTFNDDDLVLLRAIALLMAETIPETGS
jgi:Nif-specific regulatory protein